MTRRDLHRLSGAFRWPALVHHVTGLGIPTPRQPAYSDTDTLESFLRVKRLQFRPAYLPPRAWPSPRSAAVRRTI